MILWADIQGYIQILKSFTQEMKKLDITAYPDAFVDASLVLLSNQQLLTVFV
jgi:hypothetical protein